MSSVSVKHLVQSSVHEAETCWYDTARWPEWVDSLTRVVSVDGGWPQPGAIVIWQSGPAGRGRVTERVLEHEPLSGQTVAVEDDSITGSQRVAFDPFEGGVEIALSLDYVIKRRSPLTPVMDLLFVRRPMTISLTKTLTAFATVLEESRQPNLG